MRKTNHLFLLLLPLAMSCIPVDFKSEGGGSGNGHGSGSSGGSGGGFFSSMFGGGGLSGVTGSLKGALDMTGVKLVGEKGRWTPQMTERARRELGSHPSLIYGLPGHRNPLEGICDNFLDPSFTPAQRVNVYLKVAPSLAYGEGHLGSGGNGGERSSYNKALGPFQISRDAKNFGCWQNGYKPLDYGESLDCVFKIMDSQYQHNNLPIANGRTHWSVLRPGHYLRTRFMATFADLAPECKKSVKAVADKNFPGAKLAEQPAQKESDHAI